MSISLIQIDFVLFVRSRNTTFDSLPSLNPRLIFGPKTNIDVAYLIGYMIEPDMRATFDINIWLQYLQFSIKAT